MPYIKIILFLYLLLVSPVFAQEAGGTLFYAESDKRLDGGFDIKANYKLHNKAYPLFIFNHYMRGIRNREYGIGCKYHFTPNSSIIFGGIYNYDRDSFLFLFRIKYVF